MKGLLTNIEKETINNHNFRRVMYTGENMQLVKMCLYKGEEIGKEIHPVDQFFRIEKGQGTIEIDGKKHAFKDGDAAFIPAGVEHNVINDSDGDLKFYTLYAPPNHKDGLVQESVKGAKENDIPFDGETTEDRVGKANKAVEAIKEKDKLKK